MFGIILVLSAIAIGAVWLFNSLVRLSRLADNAWSDIDVQLKRRHNLVPNLVEVVKDYKGFERDTLLKVVEARGRAVAAQGPSRQGDEEAGLARSLKTLFALAEAYPERRAEERYAALQASLVEIEDAIQDARRYYNAVVRDLNTKVEQFPSNLVAAAFRFQRREYFGIEGAEREVVRAGLGGGETGR